MTVLERFSMTMHNRCTKVKSVIFPKMVSFFGQMINLWTIWPKIMQPFILRYTQKIFLKHFIIMDLNS